MKKECAHTRKLLPKYLHGHLFKLEQIRIERHLRSCVVCYSQYQMLKRTDETRKYLKDITPPEGALQIMKEGISGLGKLKKLLYRPLWIAGIVVVLAVVVYYLSKPRQLDVEIDNIVKTTSSGTIQAKSIPIEPVARPAAVKAPPVVVPSAAPIENPLAVSIAIDDDKASMRRINGIMAGHGQLRKYKFTSTVREISGSLTKKELLTFFNRVASFGKVSYNQKRFALFPAAHQIPFVMKLTLVPKAPEEQAPSVQPAQKPGEAAPPSLPATSPTPSIAR
jgi:hypothetical protein